MKRESGKKTKKFSGAVVTPMCEKDEVGLVCGVSRVEKGKKSGAVYASKKLLDLELDGVATHTDTANISLFTMRCCYPHTPLKVVELPGDAPLRRIAKLHEDDLVAYLVKYPQRAKEAASYITGLEYSCVRKLLERSPGLFEFCDISFLKEDEGAEEFSSFWGYLLSYSPELYEKSGVSIEGFLPYNLMEIGVYVPQLFPVSAWKNLSEEDRNWIVHENPGLVVECPLEYRTLFMYHHFSLAFPTAARKLLDSSQWKSLPAGRWVDILRNRPELADLCDWDLLKKRLDIRVHDEEEECPEDDYPIYDYYVSDVLENFPDKKYVFEKFIANHEEVMEACRERGIV